MNLQNRKPPYTPNAPHFHEGHLAVRKGLEPSTPGVTGPYSNQLNYRTSFVVFGLFLKRGCKVTYKI